MWGVYIASGMVLVGSVHEAAEQGNEGVRGVALCIVELAIQGNEPQYN